MRKIKEQYLTNQICFQVVTSIIQVKLDIQKESMQWEVPANFRIVWDPLLEDFWVFQEVIEIWNKLEVWAEEDHQQQLII